MERTITMRYLAATLHILVLRLSDLAAAKTDRSERGSVTIEQVLWAVAVIAIAGIVIAAVKAYVTSQAGKLG
jgi:heme/copper-type cytochrome/quinol oxidase subunit 2